MTTWGDRGGRAAAVAMAMMVVAAMVLMPARMGRAQPAAPASRCTDLASCIASCNDGEGDPGVCTQAADGLAAGRGGTVPDHARALRLYRAACGLSIEVTAPATGPTSKLPRRAAPGTLPPPPPPSRGGPGGDYGACKAASILHATGWLFEVDADEHERQEALDRAARLATAHCTATDFAGCAVASWAARERAVPGTPLTDATDPVKLAERGCTQGRQPDACVALRDLAFRGSSEGDATRIQASASAGLVAGCVKDSNVVACQKFGGTAAADTTAVRATLDKLCTDGNRLACGVTAYRSLFENFRDPVKAKVAFDALLASCTGVEPHELCTPAASKLALGDARLGVIADPAAALAIAEQRCTAGDNGACRIAEIVRGPRGPETLRDPAKARTFADRACTLSSPTLGCQQCSDDPTLPACKLREAFRERQGCMGGKPGTCERVAVRFETGDGVTTDLLAGASYLRRGCDTGEKSACIALDQLCIASPDLPAEVCAQALIHSDLFYEAEYQLAAGGDMDLVDPDAAGKVVKTPGAVTVADVAAQVPTGYKRGHLDADLVVDIVLDRARQAAIKLVVNQLLTSERKARYRYLRDLLDQGARLLADPSTLRREKFQDLGMTVVRAFVASNLIDGLYPTGTALFTAPVIGPTVKLAAGPLHVGATGPLDAVMHGYLVDVAYYWLGQTRLFGATGPTATESLACPWVGGPGATLCTQLAERATAEKAIGVDKVLDGLRLAKALRDGGFDDLRRLIEASSRSSTIADLGSTPGLTLDNWQQQLVSGSRSRLESLGESLTALRAITRVSAYADTGPELPYLKERAASAKRAIESPAIRLGLGADNVDHVVRLIRLIERADRDMIAGGGSASGATARPASPAAPGGAAGQLDVPSIIMANLRKDASTGIQTWSARDVADFSTRLTALEKSLGTVLPAIDRLESSIADIRAVFARFPNADGTASLDVGNIPLYATGDLEHVMFVAEHALAEVDTGLHSIFPGEVQAQVQFARSATVRLIGFLDLMKRVARSSGLSQKAGDVISSLRLLGTYRTGIFDAPLYDVLEPVIDSIQTHEPMSLELLFAVIGRVRLDTLITALQGKGNACKKEASVDCWTTKLIHALQESVERTGDEIHIDGGKFAQRLAQHGDDFRKRHKWRGYLHLTVGFGDLYSDPAADSAIEYRNVPLISEQIGVGYASPSFSKDRLSFKVATAASGLLYRAVLDSEESKAVMVHPILFALDIGELVELYVSPAMLLIYPPEGGRNGTVRWGASVGLSVPLTAYLERL